MLSIDVSVCAAGVSLFVSYSTVVLLETTLGIFRCSIAVERETMLMLRKLAIFGVAFCVFMGISIALAQDRSQTRSMVMARSGIVASESVLASQVGARILESGGNAIDAAVATNAVMGLVAPMNDGIGGD